MIDLIKGKLIEIGVDSKTMAFKYAADAVMMILNDYNCAMFVYYADVAQHFNVSPVAVESGINAQIKSTAKRCNTKFQDTFRGRLKAGQRTPSAKVFLYAIADAVREHQFINSHADAVTSINDFLSQDSGRLELLINNYPRLIPVQAVADFLNVPAISIRLTLANHIFEVDDNELMIPTAHFVHWYMNK